MGRIRNVRVWVVTPPEDGPERRVEVAGFWQHGNVTIASFITWLGICITVHDSRTANAAIEIGDTRWGLYPAPSEAELEASERQSTSSGSGGGGSGGSSSSNGEQGAKLLRPYDYVYDEPLQEMTYDEKVPVGDYIILRRQDMSPLWATESTFPYLDRNNPKSPDEPAPSFVERLRRRDGGCCITGRTKEDCGDDWDTFAAAYIFPRNHLEVWKVEQLGLLVRDDDGSQGANHIESVQNGLLLQLTEYAHWNAHNITVDVDNGYSIIDFTRRGSYSGRRLLVKGAESRYKPLDDLLRYHYLQAILANVRGLGKADPAPTMQHAALPRGYTRVPVQRVAPPNGYPGKAPHHRYYPEQPPPRQQRLHPAATYDSYYPDHEGETLVRAMEDASLSAAPPHHYEQYPSHRSHYQPRDAPRDPYSRWATPAAPLSHQHQHEYRHHHPSQSQSQSQSQHDYQVEPAYRTSHGGNHYSHHPHTHAHAHTSMQHAHSSSRSRQVSPRDGHYTQEGDRAEAMQRLRSQPQPDNGGGGPGPAQPASVSAVMPS